MFCPSPQKTQAWPHCPGCWGLACVCLTQRAFKNAAMQHLSFYQANKSLAPVSGEDAIWAEGRLLEMAHV